MKVRNAPPVQPCATTRVGVTSESLLRRSRKLYKFARPPAGSLHRRRELASGPGLRETSKLHFRSLQPVTIRLCLSYWLDRFTANSARDCYTFRANWSFIPPRGKNASKHVRAAARGPNRNFGGRGYQRGGRDTFLKPKFHAAKVCAPASGREM